MPGRNIRPVAEGKVRNSAGRDRTCKAANPEQQKQYKLHMEINPCIPEKSTTQRNYSKDHESLANDLIISSQVWAKTPSKK